MPHSRSRTIPLLAIAVIAVIAVIAGAAPAPALAQAQAWTDAETAFMSQRFAQAESLYRAARHADPDIAHRRGATLMLSTLAWRIHGDTLTGGAYLDSLGAMATGDDTVATRALVERSRMELASGNAVEALALARRALPTALRQPSATPVRTDAVTALGEAALEPYRARIGRAGGSSTVARRGCDGIIGMAALRGVHDVLVREVAATPGALTPAQLLMESAALLRDSAALRAGWESYYLTELGEPGGMLVDVHRAIVVPGASWATLDSALSASRMFGAAALVSIDADGHARTDGAARAASAIVPYAAYCRAVRARTDAYYREVASGTADTARWIGDLTALTQRVAAHYVSPVPTDSVPVHDAMALIERRFGARVNLGMTAGVRDLHMGHAVVDAHWTVSQYGHDAAVHFVSLDAMPSDGYQSWAWDGRAAHGGWGTDSVIVQVRPVYARDPLRVWHSLGDSGAARDLARVIAADSAADVARAQRVRIGYFAGVEKRLLRDGEREILDAQRARGYRGSALEQRFKSTYAAAIRQSSIVAHEGRHAIDATLKLPLTSADREFRAKLSEVAFAPVPRLALGSILNETTGDETPHGVANARLLEAIERWIDAHRDRIAGDADRRTPAVLLIPRLSDDQLRDIVRLNDPLATGRS